MTMVAVVLGVITFLSKRRAIIDSVKVGNKKRGRVLRFARSESPGVQGAETQ